MGIRSSKAADHVQFAANTVIPVGSGSSGGGHNRVADDQNMKSYSSIPPATITGGGGATNGSSLPEPNKNRNLKIFTYAELRSATGTFRSDTVIGEGGFGRTFRGWLDKNTYAPSRAGVGIPIAVKKTYGEQAHIDWQAKIDFLGKYSHPNLIKLLGYCRDDREVLLVYEYMQKGSLETHLFGQGADTLPWEIRLKIAIDAARGLAFLHNTEQQVIYRDFKASSILLDGDYNAKLSNFRIATSGPLNGESHVTTLVVGTYGYTAPDHMSTGHLCVKSDVFSFGVVLLELLTGKRVFDLNRPSEERYLVDCYKPMLPDKKKLRKIMDPRLEGQYSSVGAFQMAELILKCLEVDKQDRPSMEEVLLSLELISTFKTEPKEFKPKPKEFKPVQRHAATYYCGIIKSTFLSCVRPHSQSG